MLFEGERLADTSAFACCAGRAVRAFASEGISRRALDREAAARRAYSIGKSNSFKCNVIHKMVACGGDVLYPVDSAYQGADQIGCLKRESALILPAQAFA